MNVLNRPGEGTWSVFAEKMTRERDEYEAQLNQARLEIERLQRIVFFIEELVKKAEEEERASEKEDLPISHSVILASKIRSILEER